MRTATCHECGRVVEVSLNGSLANHGIVPSTVATCSGSFRRPAWVVASPEQVEELLRRIAFGPKVGEAEIQKQVQGLFDMNLLFHK